ncbi:hypothetical protein L226DRAFT_531841 [Lentinus tigrinus ALCF2SS1-7]|uniref:uncharacterized protein n=1 Tax=Lentinus tigrinus ALCF2SS1-7 TaxID=1328758 RepID=UPI001165D74E|nr:hypothetical protein L226DRAFT_531841 [Lentinus tigrinus ALCF2SS1-7]
MAPAMRTRRRARILLRTVPLSRPRRRPFRSFAQLKPGHIPALFQVFICINSSLRINGKLCRIALDPEQEAQCPRTTRSSVLSPLPPPLPFFQQAQQCHASPFSRNTSRAPSFAV